MWGFALLIGALVRVSGCTHSERQWGGRHTELSYPQLQHLIFACQVLGFGLVEGALVAASSRAGKHVVGIIGHLA